MQYEEIFLFCTHGVAKYSVPWISIVLQCFLRLAAAMANQTCAKKLT